MISLARTALAILGPAALLAASPIGASDASSVLNGRTVNIRFYLDGAFSQIKIRYDRSGNRYIFVGKDCGIKIDAGASGAILPHSPCKGGASITAADRQSPDGRVALSYRQSAVGAQPSFAGLLNVRVDAATGSCRIERLDVRLNQNPTSISGPSCDLDR